MVTSAETHRSGYTFGNCGTRLAEERATEAVTTRRLLHGQVYANFLMLLPQYSVLEGLRKSKIATERFLSLFRTAYLSTTGVVDKSNQTHVPQTKCVSVEFGKSVSCLPVRDPYA